MNPTCCVCGNAPRDFVGALTIRGGKDYCRDETGCAHRQVKNQAGIRPAAAKPAERRAIGGDEPGKRHATGFPSDGEKAAFFAQRGAAGPVATKTGSTASGWLPSAKSQPDEKPERRTVDEILYGATGDERGGAPRRTLDEILQFGCGTLQRSADPESDEAGPNGEAMPEAGQAPRVKRSVEDILFGVKDAPEGDVPPSNADSADSNEPTPAMERAWTALEAAVQTGDTAAMLEALMAWCEVSDISLQKAAKRSLNEILFGESSPEERERRSLDGGARRKDTVPIGLRLTPSQFGYWTALMDSVCGVGMNPPDVHEAAREFYDSLTIMQGLDV